MNLSRPYKTYLFRAFSVALGLGIVLGVEIVLRFTTIGRPDPSVDPFVGFSQIFPLFELNESGEFFETATSRTNYFVRDRFPSRKRDDVFRAFFLGGSTVQGRPYAIETAFPRWIQKSLEIREPDRDWEMINCGGISYASYRLVGILEECLSQYEPDLVVLCTGQNEFLEERTYGEIKHAPPALRWIRERLSGWRLYSLMNQVGSRWRQRGEAGEAIGVSSLRPILPSEVDAFLDYKNGLDVYHWDPEWRHGVSEHFRHNIERMVRLCREASVPLVILSPPINLRSSPPFKSEHRSDLSQESLDEWQQAVEQARAFYSESPRDAVDRLRRAIELDPQYADTHFALGTMLEGMGRRNEARRSFLRAKELDVCPLRILKSERVALTSIARRFAVPFIDLHEFLEGHSDYLTLGNELMVDHVHPSITGHQLIANRVVELWEKEGWVEEATGDWQERQKAVFAAHMDSLDTAYYVQGKLRLENLMLWTQGRTDGLPIELKPPTVVGSD